MSDVLRLELLKRRQGAAPDVWLSKKLALISHLAVLNKAVIKEATYKGPKKIMITLRISDGGGTIVFETSTLGDTDYLRVVNPVSHESVLVSFADGAPSVVGLGGKVLPTMISTIIYFL